MILDRLEITNFRNIEHASIKVNPHVNIVYGSNGSGKTSILEVISLLAHGKSFRSHLSTPLIKHGETSTVLFSSLLDPSSGANLPIGIEKHLSKGTTIRINKQKARSTSELAKLLPLLLVDGSTFSVVDGPSKQRRKVLDWLLFHVEPQFHGVWLGYYGALKQRNALLRRGIMDGREFQIWTNQCIDYGVSLTHFRETAFSRFRDQLGTILDSLSIKMDCEFSPGWKSGITLSDSFIEQYDGDVQRQTTRSGPHRSDLLLTCTEGRVSEVFSRGQKKTAILGIYLAILELFISQNTVKPIIAVDDLPAELDKDHIGNVIKQVLKQARQVFITAINLDQVLELIPPDVTKSVFHVEHGKIKEIKTL